MKQQKVDTDFTAMRETVRNLFMSFHFCIEHATMVQLTLLTRYLFQAADASGITSVIKSKDAMLINLVDKVGIQTMVELIEDPPKFSTDRAAMVPALYVPAKDEEIPEYVTFSEAFGVAHMDMDLQGQVPILAPACLEIILEFGSERAKDLIGESIFYRFDEDDGEWAIGVVKEALNDTADTTTFFTPQGAEMAPFNFLVEYGEEDHQKHLLFIEQYATSFEDEPGSWCILRAPAKGRGKAKAKDQGQLIHNVASMSADERAALRAALDAADDDE